MDAKRIAVPAFNLGVAAMMLGASAEYCFAPSLEPSMHWTRNASGGWNSKKSPATSRLLAAANRLFVQPEQAST